MNAVRVIEKDGKPAFYVVPAELWERVRELVDEAIDVAVYDRAIAADDGIGFPAEVAFAIADGASPLRAWREHRGMTLQALASAAGLSKPFVSQIETGKRTGTTSTLSRLASALGVPVGALVV
ncbi:MAG: helix-turn-helix transcriptional regulator [Rhodocyclaceae bacterium]|nr:helix-turn-helix transcriptional regulator [Rhodocyclaceae bacterium]